MWCRDRGLGGDICQGAEKIRAVNSFSDGAVEAGGSNEVYSLSGTGRDNRFVRQMGFEGEAAGAVGLYQDVVRYLRKAGDGDEGGG